MTQEKILSEKLKQFKLQKNTPMGWAEILAMSCDSDISAQGEKMKLQIQQNGVVDGDAETGLWSAVRNVVNGTQHDLYRAAWFAR